MPDSNVCKFRGDQPDDDALLGRNFKWNISATNTGAGYVDFLEQEYNGRKSKLETAQHFRLGNDRGSGRNVSHGIPRRVEEIPKR